MPEKNKLSENARRIESVLIPRDETGNPFAESWGYHGPQDLGYRPGATDSPPIDPAMLEEILKRLGVIREPEPPYQRGGSQIRL